MFPIIFARIWTQNIRNFGLTSSPRSQRYPTQFKFDKTSNLKKID